MKLKNILVISCVLALAIFLNNAVHISRHISEDATLRMRRNVESVEDQSEKGLNETSPKESHSNKNRPSHEMHLHTLDYRPEGFSMAVKTISDVKTIISFEYNLTESVYDQYIFRIRFHGYLDYATEKHYINMTGGQNQIILHDFEEDEYVTCVTFFASNHSEVPPLSTSGMCLDFLIGEETTRDHEEPVTGLLTPLLIAVAAVFLIAIALVDIFIKGIRKYKKKRDSKKKANEKKSSRKMSLAEKVIINSREPEMAINKNDLSQVFHNAERRGSIWDNRVQGRLVRMSEGENDVSGVLNNSYINDEPNLESLETLRHLLNSKPWAPAQINSPIKEEDEPAKPRFF